MAVMGGDSVSSEGKTEITRRGFIKETAAAGTVAVASNVLGRRGEASAATATDISLSVFNAYGADLEKMLLLRAYPIAIKMRRK